MRHYYGDEDSEGGDETHHESNQINDPEVWQDHYSEELVTGWHLLTDWLASRGLAVLDRASFHDFATWAFHHSSRVPPRC